MKTLVQLLDEVPETIEKGKRSPTIFDFCVTAFQNGITRKAIEAAAKSINKNSCVPPKNDNQLTKTINQAEAFYKSGKVLGGAK